MPFLERPDGCKIYYEVRGAGIPVLFLAPGGMTSQIGNWGGLYNPVTALPQAKFQLIVMDQRTAGQSTGPFALNGWNTFTQDQLALLDHLGIHKCLLVGSCIGPSYSFALMQAAPERFPAAVMLQPVGLSKHTDEEETWDGLNRAATSHWYGFDRPFSAEELARLQDQMFTGRDFVFSVSRDFVRGLEAPLLVLSGTDAFHPAGTSREIALLAPNVELIDEWKIPDVIPEVTARVEEFMLTHGTDTTAPAAAARL